MLGLPWWVLPLFIGGCVVGWLAEWLFELWYYRRKRLVKATSDFALQTELAAAQKEVALVRNGSEMNGLRADLSSALTAKANVEGQLKSANLDLGNAKAKFSALQIDFDKLNAEHKVRADEVGALKTNLASLTAALKDKEAELSKVRLDWDSQLRAKINELDNTRLGWDNDVKAHRVELGKLQAEQQSKLGEIATLTAAGVAAAAEAAAAERKAKDARIGELENELRLSQQRFADLEVNHNGNEANWRTRFAALQGDFDTTSGHRNELEVSLKARDLELADVRAALAGLSSSKAKLELALADGQKETANLRGQLTRLQTEHGQLRTSHSDLESKLQLAESNHGNTRNLFVALQSDFDQSKANADTLQTGLSVLKAELASSVNLRGELETGLKARDLELTDARAAIDQLTQHKLALEGTVVELKGQVGALQGDLNTLRDAHTHLSATHAALEGKLKLADDEHGQTRLQFASLQTDFVKLKDDHGTASNETVTLRGRMGDLTAQLVTLQSSLDSAVAGRGDVALTLKARERELANAGVRIGDLNARVATLQGNLDSAVAGRGDVALTLKARERELADAGVRIGDLNAKLTTLQEAHEQLTLSRDDLEGRLKLAEADLSQQKLAWQNDLAAKECTLTDLNMKIVSLQGEHEALKNTHTNKVGEIATLMAGAAASATAMKAKEDEWGTLRGQYESTLSTRQNALSEANGRIEALQGNLNELSGVRDQLQGTVLHLQAKVNGLQTELAALQGEHQLALATRNELEAKLKAVDDEHGQTRMQFANLQTDFVRLKDDHGSTANEANTLRARIGELEATLSGKQGEWEQQRLTWQGDLAAKENAVADLNMRVVALQNEHERLKATHSGKLNDIAALTLGATASASILKAKDDELATLRTGYEVAIREANARAAGLQSNLNAANQVRAELEARLKATQDEHGHTRTQFASLQTDFVSLKDAHGSVSNEANALRGRISELETNLSGRETTVADLNARIAALQGEHETLKHTHGSKLGEIATLMAGAAASAAANAAANAAAIKAKDDEIGALRGEVADLTERRGRLDRVVADLQHELGEVRGRLNSTRADYDTLHRTHVAAVQGCEADQAAWQGRLGLVEVRLKDQERGLADWRAQALHLQQTVDQLAAERAQLQDRAKGQAGEVAQANVRWQDLQVEYERLKSEHGSKTNEIASLMAGASASAQAAAQAAQTATLSIQNKDNEINLLKAHLAEVSGALQDAANARAGLEAQLREAGVRAEGLQGEVAQLQAAQQAQQGQLSAITAKLTDADNARQQREGELSQLRAELQAAAQSKRDLQEQFDTLDGEATRTRIKLSDLEARLGARDAEAKATRTRLSDLDATLATKDKDLNNARWRFGEMEAELARLRQANLDLEAHAAAHPAAAHAATHTTRAIPQPTQQFESAQPEVVARVGAVEQQVPQPVVGFVGSAEAPEARAIAPAEKPAQAIDKSYAAAAAAQAGIAVKRSECPQHLSEVQGIGTVFEQRLYEYGIGTYWELAHMSDAEMRKALKLDEIAASSKSARMVKVDFEAIRADALRLAKETDAEGRVWADGQPDNFVPIEGIGHTFELRLYNAGICTYAALIATDVERLAEICRPPKRFKTPDYKGWQTQAAALLAKKQG